MNNIYWVGVRQSDIKDMGDFFKGSVTIFGDGTNNNISFCPKNGRYNHNMPNPACDAFFEKTLESLCQQDDSVQFMFYNPILAYGYSSLIRCHTICLNQYEILSSLSDKGRSRYNVRNIMDKIPLVTLLGSECRYNILREYFHGYDKYIVQKAFSSGGDGSFIIEAKKPSNTQILDNNVYIVSPYIENAISLNTHLIICDDVTHYFPSSVQIITEINNQPIYCGADYICYNMLSTDKKALVAMKIKELGEWLKMEGYRGIIGIDLLLKDENIYFLEFNARFQASSQLLSKALYEKFNISLPQLNYNAFHNIPSERTTDFCVGYSNYNYTTSNISLSRLKQVVSSREILNVQTDGFNAGYDNVMLDANVYLCRCVFNHNICSLQNDRVILHPNIYVEDMKMALGSNPRLKKAYVKLSLLNHGIVLSPAAFNLALNHGKIKEAVFDAIDIVIFDNVHVNVPNSCKFNTLSPYVIDEVHEEFVLRLDDEIISKVKIYFEPNTLMDKYTSSGVPYDAIINLATDRIRINPAPICYFKKNGISCKFCNLPEVNTLYDIDDIFEVIDYCLANVEFRHFLIGGGTYSLGEDAWQIILKISSYIRQQCEKKIYLMSIPPVENEKLDNLKVAGITEVAFNLEMFNRDLARQYMPGKGYIDITQYEQALRHSVSLWGHSGNVRSLLIYGFDSDYEFLQGIEHLCRMGVEPIISIFRPLKNTALELWNPPRTIDIFSIYDKCQEIAGRYNLILGPDCPMCQNNTLSYSE